MDTEFLSADEVGARLRIAGGTVRAWARRGRLPSHRFGSSLRFDAAEIETWIRQQHRVATAETQPEQPVADARQAELDLQLELDPVLRHVLDTPEEVTP